MINKVFLATPGNGIARAECGPGGQWSVDLILENQYISCLAADPRNPKRIYAGTDGQGVLLSEDRGKSWKPSSMQGQTVKSLAVSPHDPNTIYAGTRPAFMHVSRNGGRSWQEMEGFRHIPWRSWWFSPAEKPWKAYIQAIAVSPTEPDVILAGIEFGAVVRSQDGGLTWSGHRKGALRDCHNLTFHRTNGKWAYEAGGTGGGASCSQDGGITWRKLKQGLAKNYGVACAADPARPEIWYVSVAPGPQKAYGDEVEAYLYRASGGANWQPIGWEPHPMKKMPIALVTDPQTPGHLYAGLTTGDIWHSVDHGDHWKKLPFNLKGVWRSFMFI